MVFFTKDPFTKNTLDCPKLQNWKKSQFRSAPDDACESRCSGCCDSVVLQGLLSIAELGREEGELGAFVSLPTLRNPVSWVRPLQIKKLTLRIWDSWNKCMIVGVWFYFLYIFLGGGGMWSLIPSPTDCIPRQGLLTDVSNISREVIFIPLACQDLSICFSPYSNIFYFPLFLLLILFVDLVLVNVLPIMKLLPKEGNSDPSPGGPHVETGH